ncbi:P-loop containing nucleoside triphosphate hydrolase protein [Gorgonomyces haynaldii]|nr:P-loop containing nucleoside triphosphate hydrolase protein [Gorgonomyces haynaldii]
MLWVDKYRPTQLDHLSFHNDVTAQLKRLAEDDMPHLMFYGPSGAGKKTRIQALLKELYGPSAEKLKLETREFVTPSNRKLEIQLVSSNYHLEITPADVGNYDRLIVQDLIKEIAQSGSLDTKKQFKIVVFNEAEGMSRDAQAGLRRTMEKYAKNIRIILCCNSTSKIIPPIRSRCLGIRIGAPNTNEICQVIKTVINNEGLEIPEGLVRRLANQSQGNLRKALLMAEACRVQQYPFTPSQPIPTTDWEQMIKEMSQTILREQSAKSLQTIRQQMYQLQANCIPADVIIKQLLFDLLSSVDQQLKPQFIASAAEYEHRIRIGSKSIFHLEAFVAKIMSVYCNHLAQ